ncbi:MAG: DUF4397 domain-containing protein, partial [Chloroflexi bacterium]|nr:DUF4397 domain-containing protein [Chloroflexota bacterium]
MKRFPGNSLSRLLRASRAVLLLVLAVIAAMAISTLGTLARQETPAVTGVPDPTIRVVHASPDAPAIDILVDGQPIALGLAFGEASEYAALSPGDHQLQVVPTNGGAPIIEQTITVVGWGAYILAAIGPLADRQLQFNEVDVTQTNAGQARVRLLNAVPDAREIGIGGAGSDELMADGVAFRTVSGYQNVTPGTYDLEVRASDTGETLLQASGVRIGAGQVYDVIALGRASDGPIHLLSLITPVATACSQTLGIGQATNSCLRVIHAAPDAGTVDVHAGAAVIAQGLEFGAASTFAAAPNGLQPLRVVPPGEPVDPAIVDEQAIVDTTLDLAAGSAAQIVVSGLGEDLQATIAGVDLRALPANQARVRVVHASPDLNAIDVAIASGPTPFQGIAFGSQSGYVVFNAGPSSFQLRESGVDTPLLEALDVPIEPGMVYDLVVIGQSETGTLQMMILDASAGVLAGPSATPIAATS